MAYLPAILLLLFAMLLLALSPLPLFLAWILTGAGILALLGWIYLRFVRGGPARLTRFALKVGALALLINIALSAALWFFSSRRENEMKMRLRGVQEAPESQAKPSAAVREEAQ